MQQTTTETTTRRDDDAGIPDFRLICITIPRKKKEPKGPGRTTGNPSGTAVPQEENPAAPYMEIPRNGLGDPVPGPQDSGNTGEILAIPAEESGDGEERANNPSGNTAIRAESAELIGSQSAPGSKGGDIP